MKFDGEQVQAKVLKVLQDVKNLPLFRSVVDTVTLWAGQPVPPSPRARSALLDSGATHVLRGPRDDLEWEHSKDVTVQLAGDAYVPTRQTSAGTILSEDQMSQVIVPLGKVIANLGFRMHWTSEECYLSGADGEIIHLDVVRGCPEVSEDVARRLIDRLEPGAVPAPRDQGDHGGVDQGAQLCEIQLVGMSYGVCDDWEP